MRPGRILALCLAAFGAIASCTIPGAEPKGDSWNLTLLSTKKTIYGGTACGPTDNEYCKTWIDDSSALTGSLRRTYEWVLDLGQNGAYSTVLSAGKLDTVIIDLLEPGGGCGSYQLYFRTRPDSIVGTFLHTSDCHGAGNSGTFVGRPE